MYATYPFERCVIILWCAYLGTGGFSFVVCAINMMTSVPKIAFKVFIDVKDRKGEILLSEVL
jgi:hypothetical protein